MARTKAKANSWFRMAAAKSGEPAEIAIYSDIGGFGVSAQDFADSLKALGKPKEIRLSISSDGGDVSTGFAIYNMLNRHPANKVVTIEGLAASMASVVAMAGDEVVMPANSMMMIHNPWGGITGQSQEIASFAEALKTMGKNIARAYQDRTGLASGIVKSMMDKETWLSAKDAVAKGFADRIEQPMNANARAAMSFPNLKRFSHVPASFGQAKERTMKTRQNAAAVDSDEDFEDGEAVAKTAAEIRAEVVAHNEEVRTLCRLAGREKMAEGFIKADKSVSEVVAALEKLRESDAVAAAEKAADLAKKTGKKPGAVADGEVSAHNSGAAGETPAAEINTGDIYAKWNKPKKSKR